MIASKDYFAKIEMLKASPLAHARIMMNSKDKQELQARAFSCCTQTFRVWELKKINKYLDKYLI